MNIVDRFYEIKSSIPESVRIVAVSKTKPVEMIGDLYSATGHKIFGENKAQELAAKQQILPNDIEWHFIGHLQSNKIKYIASYIDLIHSVDSFKLLIEINKEALRCNRIIPCLLQFHIAQEEAKYGFSFDAAKMMLDDEKFKDLTNISVRGVMGMATLTKDEVQIRSEFITLNNYFHDLKTMYFAGFSEFNEISMGMTEDYHIAIEEGSTLIRVGSGIFGFR
jgi:pyridoxal phosphate enzyme (YggS family)